MAKISRRDIPGIVKFLQKDFIQFICDTGGIEQDEKYWNELARKAIEFRDSQKENKRFKSLMLSSYIKYLDEQYREIYGDHKEV